jgi:hypothetical protein
MKVPSHGRATALNAAPFVRLLGATMGGYSSLMLVRHAHHKRQGAVRGGQLQQHCSEAQGHHHPLIPVLHNTMLWQILQRHARIC